MKAIDEVITHVKFCKNDAAEEGGKQKEKTKACLRRIGAVLAPTVAMLANRDFQAENGLLGNRRLRPGHFRDVLQGEFEYIICGNNRIHIKMNRANFNNLSRYNH